MPMTMLNIGVLRWFENTVPRITEPTVVYVIPLDKIVLAWGGR